MACVLRCAVLRYCVHLSHAEDQVKTLMADRASRTKQLDVASDKFMSLSGNVVRLQVRCPCVYRLGRHCSPPSLHFSVFYSSILKGSTGFVFQTAVLDQRVLRCSTCYGGGKNDTAAAESMTNSQKLNSFLESEGEGTPEQFPPLTTSQYKRVTVVKVTKNSDEVALFGLSYHALVSAGFCLVSMCFNVEQ